MISLHKISVSFFLLFLFTAAKADNPYRFAVGAREAGMGNISVMNYDFWSSFNNQAGLALNKSLSAGINYENRFGIKELGSRSAAVIIPSGRSTLGLFYSGYGYSDLTRHFTGAACGVKLSEKISAGIQIDYLCEKTTGEYQNIYSLTSEAGLMILPSSKSRLGLHIFNPVPNSLRRYYMPSAIRIGTGYFISNGVFMGIELEKWTGNKIIVRTGFEYEPLNKLVIRCGLSNNPGSFSLGIGYKTKYMGTDIGFVTHDRLGITSSISVILKL